MTDLLSLLEAAARESIPINPQIELLCFSDQGGKARWRCTLRADGRILFSAVDRIQRVSVLALARTFVSARPTEHTPAVEALRKAVSL